MKCGWTALTFIAVAIAFTGAGALWWIRGTPATPPGLIALELDLRVDTAAGPGDQVATLAIHLREDFLQADQPEVCAWAWAMPSAPRRSEEVRASFAGGDQWGLRDAVMSRSTLVLELTSDDPTLLLEVTVPITWLGIGEIQWRLRSTLDEQPIAHGHATSQPPPPMHSSCLLVHYPCGHSF